jgi:hypothetical protein
MLCREITPLTGGPKPTGPPSRLRSRPQARRSPLGCALPATGVSATLVPAGRPSIGGRGDSELRDRPLRPRHTSRARAPIRFQLSSAEPARAIAVVVATGGLGRGSRPLAGGSTVAPTRVAGTSRHVRRDSAGGWSSRSAVATLAVPKAVLATYRQLPGHLASGGRVGSGVGLADAGPATGGVRSAAKVVQEASGATELPTAVAVAGVVAGADAPSRKPSPVADRHPAAVATPSPEASRAHR